MSSARKKLKKPPRRNQATTNLLEGLAEMESYVKRGMTIDDMKREIQHRRPERVRVVFRVPNAARSQWS